MRSLQFRLGSLWSSSAHDDLVRIAWTDPRQPHRPTMVDVGVQSCGRQGSPERVSGFPAIQGCMPPLTAGAAPSFITPWGACSPRKSPPSTSISWSCRQFSLLSSSSNTSSRAKQWGCLQITPQLWHTFCTREHSSPSTTKPSGGCVGRRAGLFLSSPSSLVDHAMWWQIPSAGGLKSFPQSGKDLRPPDSVATMGYAPSSIFLPPARTTDFLLLSPCFRIP